MIRHLYLNLTVHIKLHWAANVLVMDIQTISLEHNSLRSLMAVWETHGASVLCINKVMQVRISSTVVEYTEVRQ